MRYEVRAQDGHYLVTVASKSGISVRVVTKDKQCSCGRPRCVHVRAVRDYLVAGGERAVVPAVSAQTTQVESPFLKCPICNEGVTYGGSWFACDIWRCSANQGHYWLWRAEQNGGAIRKFMCGEGAKMWQELLEDHNRVGK